MPSINISDFNDSGFFNADKTLREDCLVYNHFSAGLCDIIMGMTIVIYQDLSCELKLVWYKYPVKKRLYSIYKSNLIPKKLEHIITRLNEMDYVKLKEDYSTYPGMYVPEDVSQDSLYYNHHGKTNSINMSSYLMNDKNLFDTKQEKAILELPKELRKWSDLMYKRITALHE